MISVQIEDFSLADEYIQLNRSFNDGAIVTFVGKVRNDNQSNSILGLTLEHYPAMTEMAIREIVEQAKQRWPLTCVRVIHRIGRLNVGEQIVFIGVASAHRKAAFDGCEFIMDFLKTKVPFWKKEHYLDSDRWVDAKDKDDEALKRW